MGLLSLALDQFLHVGDALSQDLLEDAGVLELLGDLCDDAVGKFLLLALLHLTFVADPRVEDGLGLGGQESLLLQLECLSFEMGGFLKSWVHVRESNQNRHLTGTSG